MIKKLKTKHIIVPLIYYFSLSFGLLFVASYWLINGSGEIAQSNAQEYFQNPNDFKLDLNPPEIIEFIEDESSETTYLQSINCESEMAKKIDKFFEDRKTPLAGLGCVFVAHANENNLNPYLLPAIAQKESSGGKTTPKFGGVESYNAWGWAVFDNKETTKRVNGYASASWEEFIGRVARGVAKNAEKRDLSTTPGDVAIWYNPGSVSRAGGNPNNAEWTKSVSTFMKMIENSETPHTHRW